MSSRNRHGTCVYCGQEKKLTADHIPPKSLFASPYPPNLLTVPACQDCNASFQKDDQYAHTVLSLDFRASKHREVQSNLPGIMRFLERPTARAFAEYLTNRTADTTILGPEGWPMGRSVQLDENRLNATGARIVRGLVYIETGKALTRSGRIKVASKTSVHHSDPVIMQFAHLYSGCRDRRDREVGTIFSYATGFGEGFSIWMMLLYGYFVWVGTVETSPIEPSGENCA